MSISLTWPGVMSTTLGKPTEHNYVQSKSFVWSFTPGTPCVGRIIGDINPSEQEITFPVGVSVKIKKLIIRKVDKTLKAGEFGDKAEIIAVADLG